MANKTITQLTAVTGVANVDEFEFQISGQTGTKKCTLFQLTEVERTARETQDNVIENSVGLASDGTYPLATMENSWYLRLADHIGIIDRSGLVEDLSSDIINALRMLDYQIYIANKVKTIEVTLTAAEVLALHTTAKILIPKETGFVTNIIDIVGAIDYNTVQYVNVAADKLIFGHTNGNTSFEISNSLYVATADKIYRATKTVNEELTKNEDFAVSCDTAITTGNSPLKFTIIYTKYAV